jgi:hypothetical protein
MLEAAQRHYTDGVLLLTHKRHDNAGYHFGLAAECALKHGMLQAGVREDEDAHWKHFPPLTEHTLQAIQNRRAAPIRAMLESKTFMQGWKIGMRYAKNGSALAEVAERWKNDANNALALLY